ncbi:uncharacterized protein LOC131670148 [Phymastichus coffea]|uniref:uncharacterized protein LOC131670148 n=1 Tax=Phymastichus coffea TaxID=108790 RepID=UPI00273BAB01|nr:uncharacterized protein LOC131670148 [Phymastichus coffea]
MGRFGRKVLNYIVLHRKCRKCDLGYSKDSHDCRLNFVGTAKAMESFAAVKLTKENSLLASCNVEIGIIISDNDSSSMAAMRNSLDYEIVKQADKNHTSKDVVSGLYKLQKNHKFKELNTDSIQYLKKCFNYSIAQNIGHSERMADAINNIPYHAFSMHRNCGSWCQYSANPTTYRHKIIGQGFTDPHLFDKLVELFSNFADRSQQYSAGATSNPNESMNASIVSRAPKNRVYGTSTSADARVACIVLQKNEGEKYICDLNNRLNCSPGKYTDKYGNKCDIISKTRLTKSQTDLRKKHELCEGPSYGTDCELLQNLDAFVPIASLPYDTDSIIVYFDLETNGFSKTADILQIAARYGDIEFATYIQPTQVLKEEASAVHGLRLLNGRLQFNGKNVETVSLTEAMIGFYEFLHRFNKKCILTAHNCTFDYTRLIMAIMKCFMMDRFQSVVEGFCDTLPLISKCNKEKGKGANKLTNLANICKLNIENAHNAVADVQMLQEILLHFKVSENVMRKTIITWGMIKKKKHRKNKIKLIK